MAAAIKLKRSETAGNPAVLGAGELAYSALADNGSNGGDRLYVGSGTETDGNAVNHVVIGGKYFTDMLDQTRGVLTANSALVVDASKKLDELLVDNLSLNGNTVSTTDTNGNLILAPNGTGKVNIANAFSLPTVAGTNAYVLTSDGAGGTSWQSTQVASGTGDVFGPATSVDNTIVRFDSTSGKAIQGSALSITDAGSLVFGDTTVQTTAFTGEKAGVGLGNVTNESKATMFTNPAFTGTVSVGGAILPTTDVAYDLGSATYRFKDLYLSGSTINLGGVLISASAGSVSFPGITNTPIGATSPSTGSFTTLATTGNLVVGGDLTVNGTVTTLNSTTITVDDKNIELASVATPTNITADGAGITVKGATDKTLNWVSATSAWTSSENLDIASGKVYEIAGTSVLSATALGSSVLSSNLTGVGTIGTGTWQGTPIGAAYVSTLNQNTTGSAATLTTPRAINGVNFDGSAAITVTAAASTLTDATLNSSVLSSSLTAVGTLTSAVWNATTIGAAYGGTGLTTATSRGVLFGNGSSALGVTAASSVDGSFLRSDSTGNPYFSNVIDGGTY
jgi:hypothetical protein